jgi:peptide/nickel transport system permease protein
MSYIIVDLTISFPFIILAETSLSFLGLGLREPIVSWGVLLYSAQNIHTLSQIPWLLITALFVVISVLAFNFLGDGLRDAADPFSK